MREEGDVVSSALSKLRDFVGGLPDEERQVLAALLAPAVAEAYSSADAADVAGFTMPEVTAWAPATLSDTLTDRIRSMHWEISADPT